MRFFAASLILSSSFYLLASPVCAADISVTPAYQDIVASSAAIITYTNHTTNPIHLTFLLQKIIATDLIGRLKFNAPLPQTLHDIDPNLSIINPNQLSLNPEETGTISATFNPEKLDPGTTAFLLLAKLTQSTNSAQPGTNINQYLGSSILVTAVGGATTKLELVKTSLSTIPIYFSHPDFIQLTLKNTGNTRSIPRGVVQSFDLFGREIMRGAVNADAAAILPGSQRLIYARLQPSHHSWPISVNRLQIIGTDDVGMSHFTHSQSYVYVHPLVIPGIAFILIIFFIIKKKH